MFIGEYTYSIDDKKRLAIPPKFREILGKKAVITKGLDTCLFLYPIKEWEVEAEKLGNLQSTQTSARSYTRIMLASARDVEFDALGRILLPEYLKDWAGFGKKVVVTGVYKKIEIWDEKKWTEYKEKVEPNMDSIAESLKEYGI